MWVFVIGKKLRPLTDFAIAFRVDEIGADQAIPSAEITIHLGFILIREVQAIGNQVEELRTSLTMQEHKPAGRRCY